MTLSSHLSKETKARLVKAILSDHRCSQTYVADEVGVLNKTVKKWTTARYEVADEYVEKLIPLALKFNRIKAREILVADLEEHQQLVRELIGV